MPWTSIPPRGGGLEILIVRFMLQKPELSAELVGYLARMQNLRFSFVFSFQEEVHSRRDFQGFCRTAMQLCQQQSEEKTGKPNLRREIEENY